ncbi:MAG: hypothetical protein IKL09_05540 [Clostridia bacterium]|nr:hypothetical protein [Clostridia bacterium]
MKMTISNKEFASSLFALALMCANEDTDNCDLTLESSKGKLICHIEFTGVPADEADN